MSLSPVQAVLALTVAVALGFVWYYGGRGRWRSSLEARLVYGVPWGTVVTVAIVVSFYLLVQGGVRHWSRPLALPFVSWSYLYPTGLLTAGIAHASPEHLISNVIGTLTLAPIAEYAWGHYPPSRGSSDESTGIVGSGAEEGWLARPVVRALVVFPGVLLATAFVTALFSLGPGLGFSGVVFAIAGFAAVNHPISTVVAIVTSRALRVLYVAFTQPVARATIDPGAPGPPDWAGIGFQVHALGFLIGVLLGVAALHHGRRRPTTERVFFGTLLFGLAQALWLIAWSGEGDVYFLYRGVGVVLVLLLTMLIAVAVAGSDRPLPRPLSVLPWAPTRRQFAVGWLVLITLVLMASLAAVATVGGPLLLTVGVLLLSYVLLALPALPPVSPDRWLSGPISRRQSAIVGVIVVTVLVAAPSVLFSLVAVGGDAVPGSGGVEAGDYTVTYEENATSGHTPTIDLGDDEVFASQQSGVIVVSDDREIWTVGVHEEVLEHEGDATVEVGGIGWSETVHAERTGWEVLGNGTAYVVDLEANGETTRSFESEPVRAATRIDGRTIHVVPATDGFRLRVSRDGSRIGEATIPNADETTRAGEVRFTTREGDAGVRVFATIDGTTVQIAEREEYSTGDDSNRIDLV